MKHIPELRMLPSSSPGPLSTGAWPEHLSSQSLCRHSSAGTQSYCTAQPCTHTCKDTGYPIFRNEHLPSQPVLSVLFYPTVFHLEILVGIKTSSGTHICGWLTVRKSWLHPLRAFLQYGQRTRDGVSRQASPMVDNYPNKSMNKHMTADACAEGCLQDTVAFSSQPQSKAV